MLHHVARRSPRRINNNPQSRATRSMPCPFGDIDVFVEPSAVRTALYALLDAERIERHAESVRVSVLEHEVAPVYIIMATATCARVLAPKLSGLTGRSLRADFPAWALSREEVALIVKNLTPEKDGA
jgi:hypothetical protein